MIKSRLFTKCVALLIVTLALQLPSESIVNLIREREASRSIASNDIAQMRVDQLHLTGPFLKGYENIPESSSSENKPSSPENANHQQSEEPQAAPRAKEETFQEIFFPPALLEIKATVTREDIHRGLFSFPSFQATLAISGTLDESAFMIREGKATRQLKQLSFHLPVKQSALTSLGDLEWNGEKLTVRPYSDQKKSDELVFAIPDSKVLQGQRNKFSLPLSLRAGTTMTFAPGESEAKVSLFVNTANLQFLGVILPEKRQATLKGMQAEWHFNALSSRLSKPDYRSSTALLKSQKGGFGFSLLPDVDPHQMTFRSMKYQIFFIVLTFTCFLLFEVHTNVRLHPVHYGLVGASLTLFYLLLLSFAEHIGFLPAYIVATLAAIGLISGYSYSILKSAYKGAAVGGFLLVLYGYFYIVLLEQEYALVFGSAGLLTALGLVMYLTRDVDWESFFSFNARARDSESKNQSELEAL